MAIEYEMSIGMLFRKKISYSDQLKVAKKQAKLGVKVLPPEDRPVTLGDV